MNRLCATIAILVVALATACGGGGGSTGGIIGPGPDPVTAAFAPAQATPGDLTVSVSEGAASEDLVTLHVGVTGVSGLFSAGFDVEFDSGNVDYVRYAAGSALEQGGNSVNYVVNSPRDGLLVVAESRVGGAAGVDVSATRTLIDLTFRVKTKGAFPLALQNGVLRNSSLGAIPGISWYAGTLQGS